MAYFSFTQKILQGIPIDLFNHGNMKRDFTYVDDVVESIVRLMPVIPSVSSSSHNSSQSIYNIGHNVPVSLDYFIHTLEKEIGKNAEKRLLPMQPGEVIETCANIDRLVETIQFKPQVSIEEGLRRFVGWYRNYYQV
jgi:UDP-glucuronate 4-epimerase